MFKTLGFIAAALTVAAAAWLLAPRETPCRDVTPGSVAATFNC